MTSSEVLSNCFKGENIIKESNQWLKHFQNFLHRSFKKIRITEPRQKSEVIQYMREKAFMLQKIEILQQCLELVIGEVFDEIISKIVIIKKEVEEIDFMIAELISIRNVKKIKEHFSNLSVNGNFGCQNMWGLKIKLNFKAGDVPSAKKDEAGNLITSKQGLLQLYKKTYFDRLAPKKARPEYETLQVMKESLFDMRYKIASLDKSDNWSPNQIEKICKKLHNSKARDELGLVYELFKPPYAGQDIYHSLTKMFNGMKKELRIPKFLEEMSISSFYKSKGSRSELKNDRGVFNVVKVRSILDKLIYSETYPTIDKNLSCSNVGGRRGRNIRDHLFVLYAIINNVINGKAEAIDIQGYDIHKCFDEMGYEEWDVGLNNDKFAMIAKLDKNAKVVVKTPVGVTEKFGMKKKVMQGTVFGPIKCSVQIDTLGRDCLTNGDGLYTYKDLVEIPALSMVDDIVGVTKCSDESVELNSIINSKIEAKKLRLSNTKCFKIHISKKPQECIINLKAHEDNIKEVKSASYLGDILNNEGSIDDTIKTRGDKSIGKTNQVISILNSVSLGMFYFDIALTLRDSIFLSGILTNSETWYNLKEEHFKVLEVADNDLMRKILKAHSKTACELFWLETGKLPIRYIISKRRFMYLWHILKQTNDQLLRKVYNAQKLKPTKGDWYEMIQSEKSKYEMDETDDEISKMSKSKFKRIVDKKVNTFAFETLKAKASTHSKSLKISLRYPEPISFKKKRIF